MGIAGGTYAAGAGIVLATGGGATATGGGLVENFGASGGQAVQGPSFSVSVRAASRTWTPFLRLFKGILSCQPSPTTLLAPLTSASQDFSEEPSALTRLGSRMPVPFRETSRTHNAGWPPASSSLKWSSQ